MFGMNPASKTATSTATATSTTATASGVAGEIIQVHSFSGGSTDQAYKVELKFGSTVKMTMYGAAGTMTGHTFTEGGPVASKGQDVTVVVTPDASGTISANISYKALK